MCQVKKEINNTLVNAILFVVQLSNERRPQISAALQRKKINKRHGAYIRVNRIRFAMNPVLRTPFYGQERIWASSFKTDFYDKQLFSRQE